MSNKPKSAEQTIQLDTFPEVLEAIKAGQMVVVADDARRENEGDLIIAGDMATPEAINFMVKEGRGLLCVAIEGATVRRLGLARMPSHGRQDPFCTAFLESVDGRENSTTGISAYDRARTIQILASNTSSVSELIRPGHVFPLEAVPGGVLQRPGHTEAAVDLAKIAGFRPCGVICEILGEDGHMARLGDLVVFARKHGLKITSVADIAAYRKRTEKLIKLEEEINFPTEVGLFRMRMYRSLLDDERHLALIMGQPDMQASALVRVHSECLTGDAFGSLRCDCGSQLREAMQMIAKEGHGVVLYMRQEGRGIGLDAKIRAYALQEKGLDTVEANEQLGFEADLRDYSLAAQMLVDLGIRAVRVITNNPRKISGLKEFGLRVEGRIPLVLASNPHNERYLETKRNKMGHLL